jgi:hypothetical protein
MSVLHVNGVPVDICFTCGSTWLDAGELERVTDGRYRELEAARDVARLRASLPDKVAQWHVARTADGVRLFIPTVMPLFTGLIWARPPAVAARLGVLEWWDEEDGEPVRTLRGDVVLEVRELVEYSDSGSHSSWRAAARGKGGEILLPKCDSMQKALDTAVLLSAYSGFPIQGRDFVQERLAQLHVNGAESSPTDTGPYYVVLLPGGAVAWMPVQVSLGGLALGAASLPLVVGALIRGVHPGVADTMHSFAPSLIAIFSVTGWWLYREYSLAIRVEDRKISGRHDHGSLELRPPLKVEVRTTRSGRHPWAVCISGTGGKLSMDRFASREQAERVAQVVARVSGAERSPS